ncbi:hypothetical protein DK926_18695 [Rhodococcus sp. Eu-32]|uniref:hypothetical protein n=1 Tax=Rhodococcus sp. Eu-32 TaxID=1017319 RepID=UPI000DF3CBDA|nr:hypothetical protein [Rhodococcus sp. Eu-32]RRQ26277.1 hypothetical protein DK926_18695 [Rhodococcus sp. Eu-32]
MSDILITKIRTGGNQMIRADVKGRTGHDTFINVSAPGVDEAIQVARDYETKYGAIADELEQVRAQGVDW